MTMTPTSTPTNSAGPVAANGQFQRVEAFEVAVGRIIGYQLTTTGFTILAHRFGVAARGTLPLMAPAALEALAVVFRRAGVHATHLRKTWDAGQQSYLTEDQVTAFLAPVIARPTVLRDVSGVVALEP